jgi:hypothetical protein
MLLFLTSSGTAPAVGPPGWQWVGTKTTKGAVTQLWSRVATAADAGQTATVDLASTRASALQLLAYAGTSTTSPVAVFAAAATGTAPAATTPLVTVALPGWVVSYWAAKSEYVTGWSLPAGQILRSTTLGTGTPHLDTVVSDSAALVRTGSAGGLTATTTVNQACGTTWTVELAPSS